MVSLMHSGSVTFKPFSVGIWKSHPLQQHTPSPRFECCHEGKCKLQGTNTDRSKGVGPTLFHPSINTVAE